MNTVRRILQETNTMKLIECPRDAMQGLHEFIPTEKKIAYINHLLKMGYDTIDFGSFVSPKAIPQMKDTAEVLGGLDLKEDSPSLLAIVANERGANDASAFEEIQYLGYPFSVSETFQKRNTGASIEESLIRVEEIQNICVKTGKELVVYLSMGFGNPYGEPWHPDIVTGWSEKLFRQLDIKIHALSDTIGVSYPDSIRVLLEQLIQEFPEIEFGSHLHTTPHTWEEKVAAAYHAGCRRMDGAIKGFGGCPMAKEDLVGNMPSEKMIGWMEENDVNHGINLDLLDEAQIMASAIMS